MIKLGLFQGCKDSSVYTNKSIWYTLSTNWKIKTKDNLNRHRKNLWQNSAPIHDSVQFGSVQSLSGVRLFVTPWIAARQASLSITSSRSSPKLMSIESVMPSSHLILYRPLLLLSQIPSNIRVFSNESTLHIGDQHIGVSASASVLPMNTQDWSPLGWTGWISLQSKGSQEFSPTPQFKSINSSALSFLHSPTLKSIHDHWKNHSLD